jgi:hypothetical protein
VPQAALVVIEDEFWMTLDAATKNELAQKDDRIKFGSFQMTGMTIFNNLSSLSLKGYDIGTVFAFDYLIWNLDRGGFGNKPNILVNDDGFLLIDHELILPFVNETEKPDKAFISRFLWV